MNISINGKKSLNITDELRKKQEKPLSKEMHDLIVSLNFETEAEETTFKQGFIPLYESLCAKGKVIYKDLAIAKEALNKIVRGEKGKGLQSNLLKTASAQAVVEKENENWSTHKVSCVKCFSASDALKQDKAKKSMQDDTVKAGRLY